MKRLSTYLLLIIVFISSCKDKDHTSLLPNVTGKSGEVVLVIEPDYWSSNVGEEFRKKLSEPYPALPQSEPVFDLVHIPYSAFTSIFKTHRNLIIAKIDRKIKEPKIVIQKNVWAKPQLIINIVAPNEKSMENIITEKGDQIVNRIISAEMDRYATNYKKYNQIELSDKIQKRFGVRLTFPQGYTLDLDTTNFVWIENRGRGDLVQGILIYTYDKPKNDLTTNYLFAKQDQFTKKYVPGPSYNSYMAVEREAIPYRREIKVHNIDVIELRSLWKVENDFMGGPFVSFTVVNKKTNKIVCIDGFVYAPQFDKRDYVRQVEAILNSIEMPVNE